MTFTRKANAAIRSTCVFLSLATIAFATTRTTFAEARKFAVVIGVSFYEDDTAAPLPFVENDVAIISESLARVGFTVYPFCEASVKFDSLSDNAKRNVKRPQPPTKKNVEAAFNDGETGVLRNVFSDPEATLLVYFSGHGCFALDETERTRLFMRDSDRDDLKNTTISAQSLREMIRATPCANRLLLLDACYAAGRRGNQTEKVGASYLEEFRHAFAIGGLEGVPTFASCDFSSLSGVLFRYVKQFEPSQKKRDVSVFTYWLNEALKGHADGGVDGKLDGAIDSDELFAYVDKNLKWMRDEDRHWQIPTIVASPNERAFTLCAAPRRGYLETIDDLADQIVVKAKILGKKEIYVEEFKATESATLRNKKDEIAALHTLADAATKQLRVSVRKKWNAIEREATMLPSTPRPENARVIVKSTVEARVDQNGETTYAMTCDVISADDATTVKNGSVRSNVARKAGPETSLKTLDGPSDVAAPSFAIEAKGAGESVWRRRAIREIDGAAWVELNPGETYRFVVRTAKAEGDELENALALRLLVDGRNTLPQYEPYVEPQGDFLWQITRQDDNANNAKEADFSAANKTRGEEAEEAEIVVAPVAPLDEARFWVLRPSKTYYIEGFYEPSLQACRQFCVVKADESADDGDAEDEQGTIVAAFYKTKRTRGSKSDVETKPGPAQRCSTFVVEGMETSANIAFARLRYASSRRLEELESGSVGEIPGVSE